MKRHPISRGAMMLTGLVLALMVPFSAGASAEPAKTSKERLSDKASDQQRVDNCRVAPERRGPIPRPDCAGPAPVPPAQPDPRRPAR